MSATEARETTGHPVVVEPWDEHNQMLVANVHPPGWVNPDPAPPYTLVVIGAGTAGLVTAIGAASLGMLPMGSVGAGMRRSSASDGGGRGGGVGRRRVMRADVVRSPRVEIRLEAQDVGDLRHGNEELNHLDGLGKRLVRQAEPPSLPEVEVHAVIGLAGHRGGERQDLLHETVEPAIGEGLADHGPVGLEKVDAARHPPEDGGRAGP